MKKNNPCEMQTLETMSVQDLERLLQGELEKKPIDDAVVHQILCVLKNRETGPYEVTPGAADAWDKFQRKQIAYSEVPAPRKKHYGNGWRRVATAAVIILVLVLVTPPVFGAENIVELVGRWTQNIFALFRADSPDQLQTEYVYKTSNPDLQKIYDSAVEQGITQRVVPTWVPEGCVLKELEITVAPEGMNLYTYFEESKHYILFSLGPETAISFEKYPKEDENVKIYEIEGKEYYIMPNADAWTAVWTSGDIGCSITTTYSEETVRYIIQSIYEDGN